MAREILFKAKSIRDGKWVEEFYGHYPIKDSEKSELENITYKHWIITHEGMCYEVDRNTLCQYTGLTDANGNKIWENDVVQIDAYSYTECEGDVCGQIVYSCAYVSFGLLLKDRFVTIYDLQGSYKTIYEVLGNAFDNPELLKGE